MFIQFYIYIRRHCIVFNKIIVKTYLFKCLNYPRDPNPNGGINVTSYNKRTKNALHLTGTILNVPIPLNWIYLMKWSTDLFHWIHIHFINKERRKNGWKSWIQSIYYLKYGWIQLHKNRFYSLTIVGAIFRRLFIDFHSLQEKK